MKATLYLICLTMICISCKKEKKEPAIIGTPNQNISTDSINGEFTVRRNCNLINDSIVPFEIKASAQFYQAKTPKYSTPNQPNVNVGNVVLNGIKFFVEAMYNFYVDSTGTNFTMPYTWQISGNGTYPAFNFTDNTNFPTYTYVNSLPDTLFMDQQNVINIGNYSGNWARVFIQGSADILTKTIEFPSNQVIIMPNEMFNSGLGYEQGWIGVNVNNSSYKPINGRMYRFNSTISLLKPVVLKFP